MSELTTCIKKDELKYLRNISPSYNQSMIIQDSKVSSAKQRRGQRGRQSKKQATDTRDVAQIDGEHRNDRVGEESDGDVIDVDRDREMLQDEMGGVIATDTTQTSINMEDLIDAVRFGLVGWDTYLVTVMDYTKREDDKNKKIDPG